MDRKDMETKDTQESCGDLFKKFGSVIASAQQELISGLNSKQVEIADSVRAEVAVLKKKLHDEKLENSKLNQKISELTEEKRRSDLSLELEEDLKKDLERKLVDEISNKRALERTIAEKNVLIETLQAQIEGFTMVKERANVSSFTQSYSPFLFERTEDAQVTTTTRSTSHEERLRETSLHHNESIVEEGTSNSMEESATLPRIRIKSEYELGPHSWNKSSNDNQDDELEQTPSVLPQHEQQPGQSKRTNLLYCVSEVSNDLDNISPYDPVSPLSQSSSFQQEQEFIRPRIKVEAEGANSTNENDSSHFDAVSENDDVPMEMGEDGQNSTESNENDNIEVTERQQEIRIVGESSSSSSSSKKKSKRRLSRMDRPCPASRKRRPPSPTPTLLFTPAAAKISKTSGEFNVPIISTDQSNTVLETPYSPPLIYDRRISKEFQTPVLNTNSISLNVNPCAEPSLNITELYKLNYGFNNNWILDNCPHAREFWYDNSHETFSKFMIRLHDDNFGKSRPVHFKGQIGLHEPTSFYLKYDAIIDLLRDSRTQNGIRLFLDVRDFNFFSHSVSKFFSEFGCFVTHFTCSRRIFAKQDVGGDYFLEFILQNLPFVEFLCFDDGKLKRTNSEFKLSSKVRDLTLMKLQSLRLINTSSRFATPFIMAILQRAPTLSHINGLPLHILSEIEKGFKITKDLNSCPWPVKSVFAVKNRYKDKPTLYLNDLTTLTHFHPSLEEADTRMFFISDQNVRSLCNEKWNEILEIHASNLKSLRMEAAGPLGYISIPRLEKCRTLVLDMKISSTTSTNGYFPLEFDLNYAFPVLTTVEISLNEKESVLKDVKGKKATELFNSHFPTEVCRPKETFQAVHRLILLNFPPTDCIEKFQKLFPNIKILELHYSLIDLSEILPLCFRMWPKLKQLILGVFISQMDSNLDSAFTGMSVTTCKSLEKLQAEDIQERILEYQKKPSINNLKDLTLLKMVLNCKRMEHRPGNCIMTKVAALYGFGKNRMPNLNTIIGFDHRLNGEDKLTMLRILEPLKELIAIDE